jgi:hypothetical protein
MTPQQLCEYQNIPPDCTSIYHRKPLCVTQFTHNLGCLPEKSKSVGYVNYGGLVSALLRVLAIVSLN